MDRFDPNFFSTIAQVSATFMGFALLTPVFQAVASGRTTLGGRYILRKKFLMKWLLLVCLPIFVLSYPLIFSLVQLATNWELTGYVTCPIISLPWGILALYYYWSINRWSKLMEGKKPTKSKDELKEERTMDTTKTIIFRIIIEHVPPLLLIFCLVIWISDLTFSFRKPDILLILVIIAGFLFILRNLGVKFDEGIVFGSSEISPKFEKTKNKFVSRIDEAVEKRKEVLEEMRRLSKRHKEDNELKSGVGYHEGEIENLCILQSKIKKLYDGIVNKADKNDVTFEDFFEFEGWREDGERRIEEFERGTPTAKKVLENVYGVQWEDERDKR